MQRMNDASTDVSARPEGADSGQTVPRAWSAWQRVLFRFFFLYLLLQTAPWTWFYRIPVGRNLTAWSYQLTDWAVQTSNRYLFHVRETLVPLNGSGDTSWAFAQLWLYLSVAVIGCVVWSLLDRRSRSYPRLGYWLRTVVRYWIATAALTYGIIKIFALQMPFPALSQLATPLGDLLPMRLSWLFMGYSTKYQVFSGIVETMAGLLLLYRRTVTLGLIAAAGAFLNVVMINLSYDVPVKLFASHLLVACLFLLLWDARRLFTFLVLNRPTAGTNAYEPYFTRRWQRLAGGAAKLLLVVLILVFPLRDSWNRFQSVRNRPAARPFRVGLYEVVTWVVNGDTIEAESGDTLRWRDVVFDNATSGSVNSMDGRFWQRYRRGYFRYSVDEAARTAAFWRLSPAFDSTYIFTARYEQPDSATIRLWALDSPDSLHVELALRDRHFQLTERQFHWLSEYNR
jgi:hypothetical protein